VKRILAPLAVLCLGFALGSCGSYVADHWPHWAGGLPGDVPPRPGAPGYEEFIAHGQAAKQAATPAAAEKTNAQATPPADPPRREPDVAQGGLY